MHVCSSCDEANSSLYRKDTERKDCEYNRIICGKKYHKTEKN